MSWLFVYIAVAWCVRAAMLPVILRRGLAPGTALAWLGIIFLHPYIGVTLYLLVGESRLDRGRVARHREEVARLRTARHDPALREFDGVPPIDATCRAVSLQAERISGLPPI